MADVNFAQSEVFRQALASAYAGVVARSIMHPFDTARAIFQVQKRGPNGLLSCVSCLQSMLGRDGWKGLYRGYGLTLTWTAPAQSLYFVTYEVMKKKLEAAVEVPAATHLLAGLAAEAVSGVVWVPLDVVKQRMQVQVNAHYAGTSKDAIRAILRHEGLMGFYKGYFTCLAAFGPYTAIHFALYEQLKAVARSTYGLCNDQCDAVPAHIYLGCAAVSSLTAAALTNPLDVIKTRLQVDPASSFRSVVRRLLAEEGVRGLGRGLGPRVLFVAPQTSLAMAAYETGKKVLSGC